MNECIKAILVGLLILVVIYRPVVSGELSPGTGKANEKKTASSPTPTPIYGIDVSHYQGKIEWSKVDKEKVSFVYIKSTEAKRYRDPRLEHNAKGAASQNIPFGFYHFFDPRYDALKQAEWYVKATRSFGGKLRPAIDVELSESKSAVKITEGVKIWLDYVERVTGCVPMIYTYTPFWESHLNESFSRFGFWLADYNRTPKSPPEHRNWLLWQFSQKGRVKGIPGVVDLDRVNSKHALSSLMCEGSKKE